MVTDFVAVDFVTVTINQASNDTNWSVMNGNIDQMLVNSLHGTAELW